MKVNDYNPSNPMLGLDMPLFAIPDLRGIAEQNVDGEKTARR